MALLATQPTFALKPFLSSDFLKGKERGAITGFDWPLPTLPGYQMLPRELVVFKASSHQALADRVVLLLLSLTLRRARGDLAQL